MTSTSILISISCLVAIFQPSSQRVVIAGIFSLSCLGYSVFSPLLSDCLYYLVAGMIDVIIIAGICYFAKPTRFTDCMLGVCVLDLFLNMFGLILYETYNNGFAYKVAFDMLYFTVICIYMTKEEGNGNKRLNWFRLPYRLHGNLHNPLYKKA